MNSTFYLAIDRLPLGTVAAIEFLPVVVLAVLGARTPRNLGALALAVAGVYLLTDVALDGDPLGVAFAFVNAALFAGYIIVSHRAAQNGSVPGIDLLGMAMLIAAVVATPIGAWAAVPAFTDPVAIAAGIGVGVSSSVIPYVTDQLAMARMSRSTYALMVALLPATATVIGIVVLAQLPSAVEATGVALVIVGVGRAPRRRRRLGAARPVGGEHGVDDAVEHAAPDALDLAQDALLAEARAARGSRGCARSRPRPGSRMRLSPHVANAWSTWARTASVIVPRPCSSRASQ